MKELALSPVDTVFKGGNLAPGQGFLLRFDRPLTNDDWDTLLETLDDMFLDLLEDAAYGEAAADLVFVIRDDMAASSSEELQDIAALVGSSVGAGCVALKISRVENDTVYTCG